MESLKKGENLKRWTLLYVYTNFNGEGEEGEESKFKAQSCKRGRKAVMALLEQ